MPPDQNKGRVAVNIIIKRQDGDSEDTGRMFFNKDMLGDCNLIYTECHKFGLLVWWNDGDEGWQVAQVDKDFDTLSFWANEDDGPAMIPETAPGLSLVKHPYIVNIINFWLRTASN